MRVTIAAVGRAKKGPELALYRHYAARLTWRLTMREIAVAEDARAADRRAREVTGLRRAMPEGAAVIAVDGGGHQLTSEAFAGQLGHWQDTGTGTAVFLIGGPDGLDERLIAKADLVLAFGRATWPHLLVRAMLVEQIYRAEAILKGHPYHRG